MKRLALFAALVTALQTSAQPIDLAQGKFRNITVTGRATVSGTNACFVSNGTAEAMMSMDTTAVARGINFDSSTCGGNVIAPTFYYSTSTGRFYAVGTGSGGLESVVGPLVSKGASGGLTVGPAGTAAIDIPAGGSQVNWCAYSTYCNTSSMIFTPYAQTVADDGAGTAAAFNINIGTNGGVQLSITCNDANGCDATLLETSVVTGQVFCATNVSANVVNFADTAGVSETAGAFAAGQWDQICFQYVTDRWVERSRSNN